MPQRLELERQLYASPNTLFHFPKALLAAAFCVPFTLHSSDGKGQKKKKKNPQSLKAEPEEILSISSAFLFKLPPQAQPGLGCPRLLSPPRLAEAGRKLGAAGSASSPAVCVRVHAHVSPAPRPGTGTAPGTVSPTAQLRGLVGQGEGGDASAAPLTPGDALSPLPRRLHPPAGEQVSLGTSSNPRPRPAPSPRPLR